MPINIQFFGFFFGQLYPFGNYFPMLVLEGFFSIRRAQNKHAGQVTTPGASQPKRNGWGHEILADSATFDIIMGAKTELPQISSSNRFKRQYRARELSIT